VRLPSSRWPAALLCTCAWLPVRCCDLIMTLSQREVEPFFLVLLIDVQMKNDLGKAGAGKGQVLTCRECKSECDLTVQNNIGTTLLSSFARWSRSCCADRPSPPNAAV
jgi:hypothetical protein